MDTSLHSKSKLSYERSFGDTVDRNPLLFRLHSHESSWTFFHPEKMVLIASIHSMGPKDSSREKVSLRLTTPAETPSSLTLEEDSEAVEKHITSWKNKSEEKSRFISLTSNVLYVFWEWKRRMSLGYRDDFIIIVLKSSELRASGRAKLGTELLRRKEHKEAFKFTEDHEEVIVAGKIQSKAILGFVSMSRFEDFIQSRCQKLLELGKKIPGSEKRSTFQNSLSPRVYKADPARARESLCFALALLAPMFVPSEQPDAEGDGQASVERLDGESKYVGKLATEMCRVKEERRKECLDMCTSHGRELLKRYRTAMQRDSGKEPREMLGKIMDEYKDWDKGMGWLGARDRT